MKMGPLDKLAYLLLVIGGLNWGLVGFFDYNLVTELFGVDSTLTALVYDAVGLAGAYGLYTMVTMMASGKKD